MRRCSGQAEHSCRLQPQLLQHHSMFKYAGWKTCSAQHFIFHSLQASNANIQSLADPFVSAAPTHHVILAALNRPLLQLLRCKHRAISCMAAIQAVAALLWSG